MKDTAGAARADLARHVLRDTVGAHGLVGVSLVAVDGTWSALRFRRGSARS